MLTAVVLPLLAAGGASAQLPRTPVLNPANGHYYQYVLDSLPGLLTFEDALARAAAASHDGVPGHLVTITSQAEQDFLTNTYGHWGFQHWLWIGASDAAVEGEWRWVAGPEAGQLFWLGDYLGVAHGFQGWMYHSGVSEFYEPNNDPHPYDPRGEDYAAMQLFGPGRPLTFGRNWWNDVASGVLNTHTPVGFIIEFSRVPEPRPTNYFSIAVLAAFLRAVERRKGRRKGVINLFWMHLSTLGR
jgi:hypothetical protein